MVHGLWSIAGSRAAALLLRREPLRKRLRLAGVERDAAVDALERLLESARRRRHGVTLEERTDFCGLLAGTEASERAHKRRDSLEHPDFLRESRPPVAHHCPSAIA